MIDPTTLRNTVVAPASVENREHHGTMPAPVQPTDATSPPIDKSESFRTETHANNPRQCQRCGSTLLGDALQQVMNPGTPEERVERLCRSCFEGVA